MFTRHNLLYPLLALALLLAPGANTCSAADKNSTPGYYQPYLTFLEKVYREIKEKYYYFHPSSEKIYKNFIKQYKNSVLKQLPSVPKKIDSIAYRGAGLLVMQLRHPEDNFTNFIPPKKAEEFSKKAYGRRHDVGITGTLTKEGYLITKVEKRSNSYQKGIRPKQVILEINGKSTADIPMEEIKIKLTPELGTKVILIVLDKDKRLKYEVISKKYFRETIESIPTKIPNIYCLNIKSINKKTGPDLKEYIKKFRKNGRIKLLILDIRGNPGGPPLAVQEISGIFIPANKKLVYYRRRNQPPSGLISAKSKIRYKGALAVLIDSKSGSSSELLAAFLKEYNRAQIIGKKPTAGFSFLKGTAKFEDKSMLVMITGFAYLFNGKKLNLNGIEPTHIVPEKINNLLGYTIRQFKQGNLFDQNEKYL
jgi:C-terminal peptidase prc